MKKSILTQAASSAWSWANRGVRVAYQTSLLKRCRLRAGRVISVGNLQAGGTGKTPMVAFLAREATSRGKRVAILSRGYGGIWEKTGGLLFPGDTPADPRFSGDEPALLHERVPEAAIGVGHDRRAQYEELLRQGLGPFDWVILDDGFQHFGIERDLDLVLLHSQPPPGTVFREGRHALKHADLVVWTKGETPPEALGRPVVRARLKLASPERKEKYYLVTGVADPMQVRSSLETAGYDVLELRTFPDHHAFTAEEVLGEIEKAKSLGARVLLTGKDWVKWRALGILRAQVDVVEPEVVIEEGKELWEFVLWGSP